MDIVLAFLSGILMKTIDEIYDTKIVIHPDHIEYLKTLCTVIFTLAFYKNIGFTLFFIILIPVCMYLKEVDNSYWKSLTPIPFIILFLQYNTFYYTNLFDLFILFILSFITFTSFIIEKGLMPEENSYDKMYFRILGIPIFLYCLYITKSLQYRNYTNPNILFIIAYCITSIIFKTILIHYLPFEETPDFLTSYSKSKDLLEAKQSLLIIIRQKYIK